MTGLLIVPTKRRRYAILGEIELFVACVHVFVAVYNATVKLQYNEQGQTVREDIA